MGHVFTYTDARYWLDCMKHPGFKAEASLKYRLAARMLNPPRQGKTILDIGCGAGFGMLTLEEKGFLTAGIDPSPYMIEMSGKNIGPGAELHRGFAEALPFDDNSFSYSCLIDTLEYVDDPRKALEEAFRVTRDRVFIGIANRHSAKVAGSRFTRMFSRNTFTHARFFSVWEVMRLARLLAGNIPVSWLSARVMARPFGRLYRRPGYFELIYKSPFSAFIGVCVIPFPRFRTRPMGLKCGAKPATGSLTVLARTKWRFEDESIVL